MPHTNVEFRRPAARSVALVLAGGRGSRLLNMTDRRAKPAVHFGGKYRIIDFALSNCINSGIRRIYVATQYKSHSLLRHIQRAWDFLRGGLREFIDLLPAQQRIDESTWYRGTADAVYQNVDILRDEDPEFIVILAGDHVYKMDYSLMLEEHIRRGADVTVGCVPVPRQEATAFGVMDVDTEGRITRFLEKPDEPPGMPGDPDRALASMGIYVFGAEYLYDVLASGAKDPDTTHDFGRDFIPAAVEHAKIFAHSFDRSCVRSPGASPYWRDVGTLDSYWEANLDLTRITPELDLYDPSWPIFSANPQLPPAKFVFDHEDRVGKATASIVAEGSIVSGANVQRSMLSQSVRVNSYAQVIESVILPDCEIGRRARLSRVILDRHVQIPAELVIGEDPELDARRFVRSEGGVTLVTQAMIDALEL